jgi:hypothetical protein
MRPVLFTALTAVVLWPFSASAQPWGGGGVAPTTQPAPQPTWGGRGGSHPTWGGQLSGAVIVTSWVVPGTPAQTQFWGPLAAVPAPVLDAAPRRGYGWGGSWDGRAAPIGGSPPAVRQHRTSFFFPQPIVVQAVPARVVPADSARPFDRREFYRRRFGRP